MTVQSDSSCAGYLKGRLSPGRGGGVGRVSSQEGRGARREELK